MVQAKRAFEAYAHSHGVIIKHYHCDNGRFCEKDFMAHIKSKDQTISFSSVNAHFQNTLTKKRIRDLQDSARTMLVHAKH
jgi:fructose-1,6-bisphosphatase